ncbi:hypothetical protein [Frankia sp. CIT1]|uniref:hypothetical protein n=1 Tax=Frankia sp. CIT1 TaxID=2880974 RepID=UPI001EF70CCA|nr:hypothetical protein [Frankia sp. CIT1]
MTPSTASRCTHPVPLLDPHPYCRALLRGIKCWIFNAERDVLLLRVPAWVGEHEALWQPITSGIEAKETTLRKDLAAMGIQAHISTAGPGPN